MKRKSDTSQSETSQPHLSRRHGRATPPLPQSPATVTDAKRAPVVLDHTAFPHIVRGIVRFAPPRSRLALRATCRCLNEHLTPGLFEHLVVRGDGRVETAWGLKLPKDLSTVEHLTRFGTVLDLHQPPKKARPRSRSIDVPHPSARALPAFPTLTALGLVSEGAHPDTGGVNLRALRLIPYTSDPVLAAYIQALPSVPLVVGIVDLRPKTELDWIKPPLVIMPDFPEAERVVVNFVYDPAHGMTRHGRFRLWLDPGTHHVDFLFTPRAGARPPADLRVPPPSADAWLILDELCNRVVMHQAYSQAIFSFVDCEAWEPSFLADSPPKGTRMKTALSAALVSAGMRIGGRYQAMADAGRIRWPTRDEYRDEMGEEFDLATNF